ncbi:hypothetical protein E8F11_11140 [Pseudomonas sp. BN417]|uniref:hypothetical protein n=1 Tax=Pseudomonas sp. BN417 TaxID=2567890 RepID=UPI0024548D12|nr:hypothetical protein [Pseudomonas sp. BN417]MDH4555723.1 hypothetical protein [Pseudomonas sp. BN417]
MTKKIPYLLPIEIAARSTRELVTEIRDYLSEKANKLWSKELNYKLNQELKKLSSKKSIKWTDISPCWKNPTTEQKLSETRDSKITKIHFAYASIYYHNALVKINSGDEQKAANFATYAAYHIGALDIHIKSIEEKKRNKTRGKAGGQGKSGIRTKARTRLAMLLETPPPGEWKDIPSAARILAPILEEFIFSNEFGKVIEDAAAFIINEIERSGIPQETFHKHKKTL